ncbi:anti-sigma factor family protein [Cupriavidus basilensis]|uniref:anti-sigma factor family protein n=1 Tax=Cupriavidus basilensis TaxID=68895 RepID=UPI0039F6C66A
MNCNDARLLLQASADGELGAGDALRLEQHLAQCTACTAQLAHLRELRTVLRAHAPYHRAGPALRARLTAALDAAQATPAPQAAGSGAAAAPSGNGGAWWQRMRRYFEWGPAANAAMAALTVATLGIGMVQYALSDGSGPTVEGEMVSSHVRALISGHTIDVASSDRHTVKPWFNGRIDYAPSVRELAPQGFPLVGGRLDYVHGRPVAVLVYRRNQHPIDVFVLPSRTADKPDSKPAANPGRGQAPPQIEARQGYQLAIWESDGMRYAAITDASADDLLRFTQAWRAAGDNRAP